MLIKKVLYLVLCIALLFAGCNSKEPPAIDPEAALDEAFAEFLEKDAPVAALVSTPFTRGVNFSGWFEANSAQEIPFTRYAEQDFIDVKSLGADVIRLPIKMHEMTLGPPNYTMDPMFFKFLDNAVDLAEKHEIYLIIDNHSFDSEHDTDENIDKILLPVWRQVAEHYKNRSDFIVYEVLNEPHGIPGKRWGEIQGMAIETIRRIDKKHAIMVGGHDWNSINALNDLPVYEDPNLIYTFHYYDPFLFTHQGATWSGPFLDQLANVPFPYDKQRIPELPKELKGSWVENSLRSSYSREASAAALYAPFNKAVAFSRDRNVPIFCGEFGVLMLNSMPKDRVRWYQFVTKALESRNVSRTSWDYFGGFGIFNTSRGGDFNHDLNTAVVSAMGFTSPPQQPRDTGPLKSGFTIYNDFPGRDFYVNYWGAGSFTMYDSSPSEGEYAIRWSDSDQYNSFNITFTHNGDFSYLVDAGYKLEFKARTERPVSFDVRFVNTESASSIPWRMRYTIDEAILPPDGKWHTISIPLGDMQEQGAWVSIKQEWLGPERKFSWKDVDQLQFVSEHGDLKNRTIWLDVIKIVEP